MTRPVFEPSGDRVLANHEYRTQQLERRPAQGGRKATLHIKLFGDDQTVTTGDGRFFEAIAEDMGGLILSNVEIFVSTASSSGIVQVQVARIRAGVTVDMLSTRIQIDANELNSADAATPYVINTSNDDVLWEDQIRIDIDAAGTGARGLGIHLAFTLDV